MSERISRDDVERMAHLARLRLDDDQIERFTSQLVAILDHAEDLAILDLDGVPPTALPLNLENVLRADEPGPTLSQQEALAAAPAAEDGRFSVPTILGEAP